MPLNVQFMFDQPQREIASILRDRLDRCRTASFVSGFATVEGLETILQPISRAPSKVATFVVGAGTYRAYEAFDRLIAAGVPQDRLFVHLGHTRQTGAGARHRFYRYHPMLHSKVYLFDMPNEVASAFIGSHNLTGFAMLGLNGEAGISIEGPANDPQVALVREHIRGCQAQSITYSPTMKEAYSWWTTQFVEGFLAKVNDQPREGEGQRTIVILGVVAKGPLPKKGDVIYFEIPEALGKIQSLRAEVHMYIFSAKPSSPVVGLQQLDQARVSLWCQTLGLEVERGGVELRADWYVDSSSNPTLQRAPTPFRPTPRPGMQQVRIKVWNEIYDRFEYLFHVHKQLWEPLLDDQSAVRPSDTDQELLRRLEIIPPEDREWFLVRGLRPAKPTGNEGYRKALSDLSPEAGGFILMSLRRRKLTKQ